MRRPLLAVVTTLGLCATACSASDTVAGRGGTQPQRSAGDSAAASSTPVMGPVVPVDASAPVSAPSSGGSAGVQPTGLALLQQLRSVAGSSWVAQSDARTGTGFALPARVASRTRLQNGVSQRQYNYALTPQSGVSVSYVRLGSPAAAQAELRIYPTQLPRSLQPLGIDDAVVTERTATTVGGRPGVRFRFAFTPTTPPQIAPVWLVDLVASGADLVLLQTVVFPATLRFDYVTPAREVQRRLVAGLRPAG